MCLLFSAAHVLRDNEEESNSAITLSLPPPRLEFGFFLSECCKFEMFCMKNVEELLKNIFVFVLDNDCQTLSDSFIFYIVLVQWL